MKTRIPIKRYVDDPSLSWEERYEALLRHHEEETAFLIKRIEELESDTGSATATVTVTATDPATAAESESESDSDSGSDSDPVSLKNR